MSNGHPVAYKSVRGGDSQWRKAIAPERLAVRDEADIDEIERLAAAVGVARTWRDVDGVEHNVADEALAAIVDALGYPAQNLADIAHSLDQITEERRRPPAMLVTEVGQPTRLPEGLVHGRLSAEDGTALPFEIENATLSPIEAPGYYHLEIRQHQMTLAVAPHACKSIAGYGGQRFWGPAVQIPSLRGATPQPYGHLGHLDELAELFAARGADAIMINPMHALLPGTGEDFSPYSASSRLFLNGALGDPALLGLPPLPERAGEEMVDWQAAMPQRLLDLRGVFARLDKSQRADIDRDNTAGGDSLRHHAIFDALHLHFAAQGLTDWRHWPRDYRNPRSEAVQRFAHQNAEAVALHMFVQWLVRKGLAHVQHTATNAGMEIGLLADLAVGVRPAGSDAWVNRSQLLEGLSIGAPPDPLGPLGQNWGLDNILATGLRDSGYAPWIDVLRASLAWSGGLRIDHAFGLSRLWVVPAGGKSRDGGYLSYPFTDLVRLAALESHRADALIIAEDLGTKPFGFAEALNDRGMLGMRCLWFERAADHGFIGAQDYDALSVAMSGTHDTPTVAGWWRGHDLDWADTLGRLPTDTNRQQEEARRDWDRGLLWSTLGGGGPRPTPDDPAPAVEAALSHIGRSASRLAIAPLEDLLALDEQVNLPGTIEDHPNWRRRLGAPLADLLDDPATGRRIETLRETRPASSTRTDGDPD